MRVLRKRITVANAHDCLKNVSRVGAARKRYIDKMVEHGWFYFEDDAQISEGDVFFRYETYFTIYKPNLNNKDDLNFIAQSQHDEIVNAHKAMIKKGAITKDGVVIMNELKAAGWCNVTYSTAKHKSEYYVECGYSGSYQQSKLIKEF